MSMSNPSSYKRAAAESNKNSGASEIAKTKSNLSNLNEKTLNTTTTQSGAYRPEDRTIPFTQNDESIQLDASNADQSGHNLSKSIAQGVDANDLTSEELKRLIQKHVYMLGDMDKTKNRAMIAAESEAMRNVLFKVVDKDEAAQQKQEPIKLGIKETQVLEKLLLVLEHQEEVSSQSQDESQKAKDLLDVEVLRAWVMKVMLNVDKASNTRTSSINSIASKPQPADEVPQDYRNLPKTSKFLESRMIGYVEALVKAHEEQKEPEKESENIPTQDIPRKKTNDSQSPLKKLQDESRRDSVRKGSQDTVKSKQEEIREKRKDSPKGIPQNVAKAKQEESKDKPRGSLREEALQNVVSPKQEEIREKPKDSPKGTPQKPRPEESRDKPRDSLKETPQNLPKTKQEEVIEQTSSGKNLLVDQLSSPRLVKEESAGTTSQVPFDEDEEEELRISTLKKNGQSKQQKSSLTPAKKPTKQKPLSAKEQLEQRLKSKAIATKEQKYKPEESKSVEKYSSRPRNKKLTELGTFILLDNHS